MKLKNQIIEELNEINEKNFLEAEKEIKNEIHLNQEKSKTLKIKKAKIGLQSILANIINEPFDKKNIKALIVNLLVSVSYPVALYFSFLGVFAVILSAILFMSMFFNIIDWFIYLDKSISEILHISGLSSFGRVMLYSSVIGLISSFFFSNSIPNRVTPIKLMPQKIDEGLELKLEELNEERIKNSQFINDWDTLISTHDGLSDSMSKILHSGVSKEILELLPTIFKKDDLVNIVSVNKSGAYISYRNVISLINLKRKEDTVNKIWNSIQTDIDK